MDISNAAAALAAHIREHLPIDGQPPPPSGGPVGGRHDWAITGLAVRWQSLSLALFAWDDQHGPPPAVYTLAGIDAIEQDAALESIRHGYDGVSRHYGFDRLLAGERVVEPNPIPPIALATVQRLEWGASKLAAQTTYGGGRGMKAN